MSHFRNKPAAHEDTANPLVHFPQKLYLLDAPLLFPIDLKIEKLDEGNMNSIDAFLRDNLQFKETITQYLISTIEEISSITFNYYSGDLINQKQAKTYASKCILENIINLCRKVSNLKGPKKLIIDINNYILEKVQVITNQLSAKYPLTIPTSVTREFYNSIPKIDLIKDYKYDFMVLNMKKQNLFVKNKQNELNKSIMILFNKIRSLPYENNDSYYDSFQKFNNKLIWILTQKEITQYLQKNKLLQKICLFLHNEKQYQFDMVFDFLEENQRKKKKLQIMETDIVKLKQDKRLEKGPKISKAVPEFTQKQKKSQEIYFKNGAMERVLIKWIENLQEIFQKSEQFIMGNSFGFKDNDQGQHYLNIFQRNAVHTKLKKEYHQLKTEFQKKARMTIQAVAVILSQDNCSKPLYLFEKSLNFSSQINSLYIKESLDRLHVLIKSLWDIPNKAKQYFLKQKSDQLKYLLSKMDESIHSKNNKQSIRNQQQQRHKKQAAQIESLNLIINRLGDSLRAKYYLKQKEFLNAIQIFKELGKQQYNKQPFFKLLRIKNKLDNDNNNVHINYLFKGKIQCELQLCLYQTISLKQKLKAKKLNQMRHYLYQLTRGLFGVVAELVSIVNKNQPFNIKFGQAKFKLNKNIKDQYEIIQEKPISNILYTANIWKCSNANCSQFYVRGKCRLIPKKPKPTDKIDQKYYFCISCFKILKNQENYQKIPPQNKPISSIQVLTELSRQNSLFIHSFLKQMSSFIQQLDKDNIQKQSIYIQIQPTEQNILGQFFFIYKSNQHFFFVMQSIKNEESPSKFDVQKYEKNRKSQKSYLFRITNNAKLINFLCKSQNEFKLKKTYLQNLKIAKIDQIDKIIKNQTQQMIRKANQQMSKKYLKQNIINQNSNLVVSKMLNVLDDMKIDTFEQRQYKNILQFEGNYSVITNDIYQTIITKFAELKSLSLNTNKISGSIKVSFNQLERLQLNYNDITDITINSPLVQRITITNNKLKSFKPNKLETLEFLSLEQNRFKGRLDLSQMPALIEVNVSYNQSISQLDIKSSSLLKRLQCRGISTFNKVTEKISITNQSKMKIAFHKNVKLEKIISINNLISLQSFNQIETLKQLSDVRLTITNINEDLLKLKTINYKTLVLRFHQIQLFAKNPIEQLNFFLAQSQQPEFEEIQLFFENCSICGLAIPKKVKVLKIHRQNFLPIGQQQRPQQSISIQSAVILFVNSNKKQYIIKPDLKAKNDLEILNLTNSQINQFKLKDFPNLKQLNIKNSFSKILQYCNSNLTNLKIINPCQNNQTIIDSLTIKNNKALKQIQISSNIKKIIIQDCSQLSKLKITTGKDFEIDQMQLKKIKKIASISINTKGIKKLTVDTQFNNLKDLDLCVEFIEIEKFSNQIEKIKFVKISNNIIQSFSQMISNNCKIQGLQYLIKATDRIIFHHNNIRDIIKKEVFKDERQETLAELSIIISPLILDKIVIQLPTKIDLKTYQGGKQLHIYVLASQDITLNKGKMIKQYQKKILYVGK